MTLKNNYFAIFILAILIAFSSCRPARVITNTVTDSTNIKVDTIYIPTEGIAIDSIDADSIKASVSLEYEESYNNLIDSLFSIVDSLYDAEASEEIKNRIVKGVVSDSSYLENEFSYSTAVVEDGEMLHDLYQKKQVRYISYEDYERVIKIMYENFHSEISTEIVPERYVPWYTNILAWIGGICLFLIILFVTYKVAKMNFLPFKFLK